MKEKVKIENTKDGTNIFFNNNTKCITSKINDEGCVISKKDELPPMLLDENTMIKLNTGGIIRLISTDDKVPALFHINKD